LLLLALSVLPSAALAQEAAEPETPAFHTVPELTAAFNLLYEQKFTEARNAFESWESNNPREPFGEVAIAATYLYEEMYRQGALTSDFFLNEKRFLHGIDGKPDPEHMAHFRGALARTRELARGKQMTNSKDPEALFALTLAAGMESDADSILEKKQLEALKRMKEANEHAKQLLARHPDATDAYIAMGIANYIIGSLNPGFRFALWFGGIHGDKKLGMEQVRKTAENGRYLRPFGKIMLALAARREKQNALAQKLLRELSEEFPSNDLFASEYAKAMGRPVPAIIER
jgi:tetratricopeptide (TPR) repeat protein